MFVKFEVNWAELIVCPGLKAVCDSPSWACAGSAHARSRRREPRSLRTLVIGQEEEEVDGGASGGRPQVEGTRLRGLRAGVDVAGAVLADDEVADLPIATAGEGVADSGVGISRLREGVCNVLVVRE